MYPLTLVGGEHKRRGQQKLSRLSFFLLPAKFNFDQLCTLTLSPQGFYMLMMAVQSMCFSLFCSRGLWEAGCAASRPELTSWPVLAQDHMDIPAQTGTTSGISKPRLMAYLDVLGGQSQGKAVLCALCQAGQVTWHLKVRDLTVVLQGLLSPGCIRKSSLDQMCNWDMGLSTQERHFNSLWLSKNVFLSLPSCFVFLSAG